jgi:hypothetical protein
VRIQSLHQAARIRRVKWLDANRDFHPVP